MIESGRVFAPRSKPDTIPITTSDRSWTTDTWLQDTVAYAPQQAYIRHGTIRDNILLGQPMWRARYNEVLAQCSLLSDLDVLDEGDMTEVGEGGVTLVSTSLDKLTSERRTEGSLKSRSVYLLSSKDGPS